MISYRSRLMASQILDVNEIDWATRRLLHGDQIVKRGDQDRYACDPCRLGSFAQTLMIR